MTSMNKVFADLPVTVFEAMSQLARDNNAINLGQGFPDDPGPEDIRRAAAEAVMDGYNQYPSMMGIPELRQAIAAHYGRWHGLTLDPMAEVMVTSGGTEALTSAILAVVEPGDEVIVFQPVYDSYLPIIRQAGGIPRLLRLEPPDWRLTEEMLQSAFNRKTKAVLFNNPLNPAAVVYPREDLELLARFCQEFESIGFPVLKSQGTYFLTVDLSPLGLNETDEAFCRRIVNDYKVAAIPVSAFYEKDAVTSVVRFCFAKKDATLDTALERLSDAVHRR